MNKYGNLLMRISSEYTIVKGETENSNQWKVRLIYSMLGEMALAALFDVDEGDNISITHLKKRIGMLVTCYRKMYPELNAFIPADSNDLSNEIYDIYLHAGVIYHAPNKILMAKKSEAIMNDVKFTRGYEIDTKQKMSGLGTYMISGKELGGISLVDMFQIETISLHKRWECCVKKANWKEFSAEGKTEYLRMSPPFNRGYWVDQPDSSGNVSILRTGFQGAQMYYLYMMNAGLIFASQLPQWQVEDYNYRSLANACLCSLEMLPASKYQYDGDLVYITFGYLPPPAELYLWKLYTWPTSVLSLPKDFNRVCVRLVFEAIKKVMTQQGYNFIEDKKNVKWC